MRQVEEQWAAIDGFPDYAVSNHGRVRSLRYDRYLTPRANSYGHERVVIYRDKQPHEFYVHHLVAGAFISGYRPGKQIHHHDEDSSNNNVLNLRFAQGVRLGHLVPNPAPATLRRIMIVESGMIFKSIGDCANYIGGHSSSIYRVLRGERPHHLGFTFRYVEEDQ